MQILLVRHAKSAHPGGVDDHDRPLTDRGVADARAVGERLATLGLMPRRIVSSTALRAAETARLIAEGGSPPPPIDRARSLYGAGVTEVLAVAADAAEDGIMIVGHEPTLSMTVAALCGASVGMVTAAVVCVDVDGSPGSGVLRWMLVPRLLQGPAV